jgi:internalin A
MDLKRLIDSFKPLRSDDLLIIWLLEQMLFVKLKRVDKIEWSNGYVLNEEGHIIGLKLHGCGITDEQVIINMLHPLTSLEHLDLTGNQLKKVSKLGALTSLKRFELSHNQLTDVSALRALTSLQQLYIADNQIADVTGLSGLMSLRQLFLDHNHITDVTGLSGLMSLRELSLDHNQITDISPLSGLTSLQTLKLGDNPITTIPLALTDLPLEIVWRNNNFEKGGSIMFYNNPLQIPPPEIVAQGKDAVRSYLLSLEKAKAAGQQMQVLCEVKVHLVGDGMAGKTSLLKQFQGFDFDPNESQTHGITVWWLIQKKIASTL